MSSKASPGTAEPHHRSRFNGSAMNGKNRRRSNAQTPMERISEFLHDPGNYPHDASAFEVHETHISRVFLAGDYAYKLKKPVSLSFIDYSTEERREHYAKKEVRLNRRLAPSIYLGLSFVREQDEHLFLDVEGKASGRKVVALVRMRRIPRERLLDHMVREGEASRSHIDQLVERLVPFYREAPASRDTQGGGSPELLRKTLLENFEGTERFVVDLLPKARELAIRSAQLSFLTLERDRFEKRLEEGKIRDGHGDLKAEHVAYLSECNVIDCIEFNERLRVGDVAADIAFLKMDLEFLGARKLADHLLERYVEVSNDEGIREVLDFYLSCRAYVRGKVDGLTLESAELTSEERQSLEKSARRHFLLSGVYAQRLHQPRLILTGGLSGTGKTTVSQALSEAIGTPAIRSDEMRKKLAGISTVNGSSRAEKFGEGLYSEEYTEKTYRALSEKAEGWLEQGASVIVDATFSKKKHRRLFEKMARRVGAERIQFECQLPRDVATERLRRREQEGDGLSDATAKIQDAQEAAYESYREGEAVPLDTNNPPQEVIDAVLETIRNRWKTSDAAE